MLRRTTEIHVHTQNVILSLGNNTFQEYCKNKFVDYKDAKLIDDIINNDDNPLMVVWLLNYRDQKQRKKIDLKFREKEVIFKEECYPILLIIWHTVLNYHMYIFY